MKWAKIINRIYDLISGEETHLDGANVVYFWSGAQLGDFNCRVSLEELCYVWAVCFTILSKAKTVQYKQSYPVKQREGFATANHHVFLCYFHTSSSEYSKKVNNNYAARFSHVPLALRLNRTCSHAPIQSVNWCHCRSFNGSHWPCSFLGIILNYLRLRFTELILMIPTQYSSNFGIISLAQRIIFQPVRHLYTI